VILTSKLVMRLYDANGALLGWCQHEAAVKGDGLLRAAALVALSIDEPGVPHELSIHWADLNVETRVPMPPNVPMVPRGHLLALFQPNQMMAHVGQPPATRLTPVSTKSSVNVGIPAGTLGALPGGVMVVSGA
jgi:hypothetical protein